ncbi:hypothetical protein XH97_12590 [Bradyrhizobium sp. CCBAU 53380]|nr:hypothetical protein [Bradyrhizobium sp. CCBAU 53380]
MGQGALTFDRLSPKLMILLFPTQPPEVVASRVRWERIFVDTYTAASGLLAKVVSEPPRDPEFSHA